MDTKLNHMFTVIKLINFKTLFKTFHNHQYETSKY